MQKWRDNKQGAFLASLKKRLSQHAAVFFLRVSGFTGTPTGFENDTTGLLYFLAALRTKKAQ